MLVGTALHEGGEHGKKHCWDGGIYGKHKERLTPKRAQGLKN